VRCRPPARRSGRWPRLAVPLAGLLLASCATTGSRSGIPDETGRSDDEAYQRCARVILGYRSLPEQDRKPQLIHFFYVLRSIYESEAAAPEDAWGVLRQAVGPPLLDLLQSEASIKDEVFYIGPAVKMISPLGLQSAVPVLREMLESKDVYVSRLAIEALGRMGDAESIPQIRKKLEPKPRPGHFGGGLDMTTPQYAAFALWRLGEPEGGRILTELLVHPAQSVRVQSAIALAEMGDATGIRVLETRLQNPGAFRIPVLNALSNLEHPRAAQLLEREMNVGDLRGRLLAALYLAERGDLSARRFLLRTAQSSNPNDAYPAAMYLARLRDRAAVPVLEFHLQRVDLEQRLAADAALVAMGSRAGYRDLTEQLDDERWPFRAIAAAMLLLFEQPSEPSR